MTTAKRALGIMFFGLMAGTATPARAGDMTVDRAVKILGTENKDANRVFSLSFFFKQAGRPFSAIDAAERAIEIDRKVPAYHARLGQLLMQRQRYREAATAYGKAADMDPKTKSFRAAQARALVGCYMLKEAVKPWTLLLEQSRDRKEILDAARNLTTIHYQLHNAAGAEKTWRAALGKLKRWSERLQAAGKLADAITRQRDSLRAGRFWEDFLKKEKDWQRRAAVADRLYRVAAASLKEREAVLDRAARVWRELQETAKRGPDKQRAGKVLAEIHLRRSQPDQALAALKPHLYASKWPDNFQAAQVLSRAYAAQGDAAGRESMWREFLKKSSKFDERNQVCHQLSIVLEDKEKKVALYLELVEAFPKQETAWARLAAARQEAEQFEEAAAAYQEALRLQRRRKGHRVHRESNYRNRIVQLLAQAGRPDRAVELIIKEFRNETYYWNVQNWLRNLRSYCGDYTAVKAAQRIGDAGGVIALGAGRYLNDHGRREAARAIYFAVVEDSNLKYNHRAQAIGYLYNLARNNTERVELARRLVTLGGTFRQQQNARTQLAQYLSREGRIEEAVEVVREAGKLRQRGRHSAGPNVLNSLARNIFQGRRVGPGLRAPEGLAAAEVAAIRLYRELAWGDNAQNYWSALQQFVHNLATLRSRRGDTDGAIAFIQKLAEIQERSFLHLYAAEYLDEKDQTGLALNEYLAYAKTLSREHHANFIKQRPRRRQHRTVSLDGKCLAFLEKRKQDAAFVEDLSKQLNILDGLERECLADVLLGFYKQRNRPEDMNKVLRRLRALGHDMKSYRQQEQWVQGAIRMKNANSRADAQRRMNLLRQLAQWQKTFKDNPEDYQAAINVYKTFIQLGRKKEGEPYLAQALEISSADPIVLERYGRELMLDKAYKGAVEAFKQAAEISGRRSDYEESMVSSFALSGQHQKALKLALDSLEEGRNRGRGVRSVEQILDLAERSDNLKHLYAEAKRRVSVARAAKRPVREDLSRLALRVAWDNHDQDLSTAAIRSLLDLVRATGGRLREEWRLDKLAQRAQERRRISDAIMIRQTVLQARAARGYSPDANRHRQLAMLLVEAERSPEAAALMFAGLARAGQGTIAPQPVPWPMLPTDPIEDGQLRRRHSGPRKPGFGPGILVHRNVRLPWLKAILEMAALEAQSGGAAFQHACGKRLTAMIEDEMQRLSQAPEAYNGPLTNAIVETGLKLRNRVTAVFRQAAKAEAATSARHLALARRLVGLATAPKEKRPVGIELAEIIAAGKAAAAKAQANKKIQVLMECGKLYTRLLALPEAERLAGVKPELALSAFEAAAASAKEGNLDALREALDVATKHKLYDKCRGYAEKLHRQLPRDENARSAYAQALVRTGQSKQAIKLVKSAFDQNAGYQDYQRAGKSFLVVAADSTAAAAAAAEFLNQAVSIYLEETGKQVDVKGKPLADGTLGGLQLALAQAYAAAGKPEQATPYFLASLFHKNAAPGKNDIEALVKAYTQAGKIKVFTTALTAAVKKEPRHLNLRLAQGLVLEKTGNLAGAAAALQAAKALRPELAIVKRLIALLRQAGDTNAAFAECEAWTESFPHDAEAWRALAAIYKDLKNEKGELQALTMLVEVAPRDAGNCRAVAVTFVKRQDYGHAIALLRRAVELRPEEPYRHIDLAEALFLAQEYASAEKICREALTRDWEKGLSPELLARMPRWRGTFEARAHSLLADIYVEQKQAPKAAKERMHLPAGYQRPPLEKAVPTPGRGGWPQPPMEVGRRLLG